MACKQYIHGTGKNLILLLTGAGEAPAVDSIFSLIITRIPNADFTLAVYEASDWDGEYSPWAYTLSDGRSFSGDGKNTLSVVSGFIKPFYESVYIAGYSLAGLFALWAIHETELFDGCACCSGSLWFGGWEEYSKTHPLKKRSAIYLSLGGKEEKVKNPIIAAIGEKTRAEDKRNALDPLIRNHTLVMNPGGHFASPDKRLAQGIVWLLQKESL